MPLLVTAIDRFFTQKKEEYPCFLIDVRTAAEIATGLPDIRFAPSSVTLLAVELGDNFADRVLDAVLKAMDERGDIVDLNLQNILKNTQNIHDRLAVKEKSLIGLICRAGVRSCTAGQLLIESGWKDVHSIKGGIYNNEGWLSQGLPLSSAEDLGIDFGVCNLMVSNSPPR